MRTEALAEIAVWTLGKKTAAQNTGRPVLARGDFTVQDLKKKEKRWQLHIKPSVPPARHAIIVGWPPRSEPLARKLLALALSKRAPWFSSVGSISSILYLPSSLRRLRRTKAIAGSSIVDNSHSGRDLRQAFSRKSPGAAPSRERPYFSRPARPLPAQGWASAEAVH